MCLWHVLQYAMADLMIDIEGLGTGPDTTILELTNYVDGSQPITWVIG